MSALSIQPTYPIFTDIDGQPLENGYVWIGAANLDPQTNPINVYWDAALTLPAAQPIRTLNGYPANNGTPARLYVNSDYSIRIMNKNGSVVYSALSATERYGNIISSSEISFLQNGVGAVERTVQNKDRGIISVNDFIPIGTDTTAVDCLPYVQAALDYARTLRARVEFEPKTKYRMDSGMVVDISNVGIEGNGAWLDFTNMASGGAAFRFIMTQTDANVRTLMNHVNSIDHLILQGSDASIQTYGVIFDDNTASVTLAGGSFNHCAFWNFGVDVAFVDGAFCWTFNKCAFTTNYASGSRFVSVENQSATNNGERNTFIDCFWFNRGLIYDCSNPNSTTFFINCSLDGAGRQMIISAGVVKMIGCHIECVDDTDYWYGVSGENTLLVLNSCEIVSQSAKTAYSIFYSDSTASNGGVLLIDLTYYMGTATMTVPLVAGTGRAVSIGMTLARQGTKPTILADSANQLAYGGFESANYTVEWTLVNGAIRATGPIGPHGGSYSLSFPASLGVTPQATCTIPASPGRFVIGELYWITTALNGTGGIFYVEINWLDKGGNSIFGSAQLSQTTSTAYWERLNLNFFDPAPKGTASFRLSVSLFGTISGNPSGWIDDVSLTLV